MINKFFNWLSSKLPRSDRPTSTTRFYILRSGWWGFGIKLHHITKDDTEYHTHPWHGISIIFGAYDEALSERLRDPIFNRVINSRIYYANRRRRLINFISATRPHKVLVGDKPVWTLFIHGPRFNKKWYYGASGSQPWRGPNAEDPLVAAFKPVNADSFSDLLERVPTWTVHSLLYSDVKDVDVYVRTSKLLDPFYTKETK